jgi:hypothetical protein
MRKLPQFIWRIDEEGSNHDEHETLFGGNSRCERDSTFFFLG